MKKPKVVEGISVPPALPLDALRNRQIMEMNGGPLRTPCCGMCINRWCEGNPDMCSKGIPNPNPEKGKGNRSKTTIVLSHKNAAIFRSVETESLVAML